MKKAMGALVLSTLLVTVAGWGLIPAPASATTQHGVQATPGNMTSHPWSYDGCSNSPESGPGWNFHHACIHHDGCYRGHWASRSTCDTWFRNDMRASCVYLHRNIVGRTACYGVAEVYYRFVRSFGGSAYAARSIYVAIA